MPVKLVVYLNLDTFRVDAVEFTRRYHEALVSQDFVPLTEWIEFSEGVSE